MSVARIEHAEMYDNKQPKTGGLLDPRMGCTDRNRLCFSCGENMNNCSGHFGHIELNSAVYHIGFIKTVKKVLECVCHKCSRFRLLPSDPKWKKLQNVSQKLKYAWENAKSKSVCEYADCESQILPVRRHGMCVFKIIIEFCIDIMYRHPNLLRPKKSRL